MCQYNPKESACKIEVDCAVLRESLSEAEQVYAEMNDEVQYLQNKVFYLERLLKAYGVSNIYDNN